MGSPVKSLAAIRSKIQIAEECGTFVVLTVDEAKALIAETARNSPPPEPTEAMQKAGVDAMFDTERSDLKRREFFLIVRKGWRAMYDAAAQEKR